MAELINVVGVQPSRFACWGDNRIIIAVRSRPAAGLQILKWGWLRGGAFNRCRWFTDFDNTGSISYLSNQLTTLAGMKRTSLVSMQFRYRRPITQAISVSIDLPLYHASAELADFGVTTRDTKWGLGDTSLSIDRVFIGQGARPHILARLSVGLPTGSGGGPDDRSLAGFSSSNWSAGGELGMQKTLGSGDLLASIGYLYYRPRENGQSSSEISWAAGYQLKLDPNWSFGSIVTGSIVRQSGQTTLPAYLTISASYRSESNLTVTPSFAGGLNADSQDFLLSLSLSRAF